MKKPLIIANILLSISLICFGCQHRGAPAPGARVIQQGDMFPKVSLKAPEDPKEQAYLGLSTSQPFLLHELEAEVILVEILNVYCHSCKRQVPAYNKLFQMIEQDQVTRGRIKLFGIAVGNNETEIRKFKDKYAVGFPILSDPDFSFHQSIGSVWTPYSIYVRQDSATASSRVTDTHLGLNLDYKLIFKELTHLLNQKVTEENLKPPAMAASSPTVAPVLSGQEILDTIRGVFESINGSVSGLQKVSLDELGAVYTCRIPGEGGTRRLFAKMVSRSVPCDVCHDAHFIYVFDQTGKILEFYSVELSKYDNVIWNQDDIQKIRKKVIGKYVYESIPFDPEIDAVSTATITSAIIFDSLTKGRHVYNELKQRGY